MERENEKSTEAHLFKEMRKIGGSGSKFVCPNHRGKPDRICEFPYGLVAFVEVKSEGDKPKAHQIREHVRMRNRGQIVVVLYTKSDVNSFVKYFKEIDNAIDICGTIRTCRPGFWSAQEDNSWPKR